MNPGSLLTASAGNHSPDVRLDCRITVRAAESQAGQVRVQSKVGSFYQESIESLVHAGLEALDASDLSVEVEDSGALPYTLLARLEAAIRRLRPDLPASRMLLPENRSQADYLAPRQGVIRRRAAGFGVRACTCPATPPNISSTPGCTGQIRSSSIWKIRSPHKKRMPPACWCGPPWSPWIFTAPKRACASIACRPAWTICACWLPTECTLS